MDIRLAPARYIREPGIISRVDQYLHHMGEKAMLIGGKTALSIAGGPVRKSIEKNGVKVVSELWYGGECSWENIEKLAGEMKENEVDFVVGIGGGKALDTVKKAAYDLAIPVVTVPTIAATCAAWTPLSIIYSPDGHYLESNRESQQPALVLVDPVVIAEAPYRYLISGMGDTLAKWYETDVAVKKAGRNAATMSAHSLSLLCKKMIEEYGVEAKAGAENKEISAALNQVIDAIVAVSGMVSDLGGDGCASAAAHPVATGLTLNDEVHKMYHGEVVSYGVLCQLILEEQEEENIEEYLGISEKLGLPITIADMGSDGFSQEELAKISSKTVQAKNLENMPFPVTAEMVGQAILTADQKGTAYREKMK